MTDIRYGTITGWGGRYKMLRSYVKGFATNWPHGSIVSVDTNPMTITLTEIAPGYVKYMELKNSFWTWSSNRNTFDYVFENFYVLDPMSVKQPAEGFSLGFKARPTDGSIYVAMDVGFWTDWYYFNLPPGPNDYWLPPL